MKVLAVGAHPDDIEIFMYGLLSVYKKGHKFTYDCYGWGNGGDHR